MIERRTMKKLLLIVLIVGAVGIALFFNLRQKTEPETYEVRFMRVWTAEKILIGQSTFPNGDIGYLCPQITAHESDRYIDFLIYVSDIRRTDEGRL